MFHLLASRTTRDVASGYVIRVWTLAREYTKSRYREGADTVARALLIPAIRADITMYLVTPVRAALDGIGNTLVDRTTVRTCPET
jgi:hypothetical protein